MNQEPLPIYLDKKSGEDFFDEIVIGRFTRISFHRTLRIPEDGRDYPLPAGLGRFPIHRVEDYAEKVPVNWLKEGGFFIPLYQKEALFLQFEGPAWHPTIAKICVGRINAITGNPYSEELSKHQQDYVVIPNQKWLDGISISEGIVKQFIAMPLGQGYTIEAQITDEEKEAAFQIVVMDAFENRFPQIDPNPFGKYVLYQMAEDAEMGIAAGGRIKQQILRDTYGVDSWNSKNNRSLNIRLVNSHAYKAITGIDPPQSPVTAIEYQLARIPWYTHYDETAPVVKPPSIFKRILGVTGIEKKRGKVLPDDVEFRNLAMLNIHKIRTPNKTEAAVEYRHRAIDSRSKGDWKSAIREISHVIDLDYDTSAEDYAFRSSCNFQIGRFKDAEIDATIALFNNSRCTEALTWRAFCRMKLGDHENLDDDANSLLKIPETELIGLEMKAEAALLAGRYDEAFNIARSLQIRNSANIRAEEIMQEAGGRN